MTLDHSTQHARLDDDRARLANTFVASGSAHGLGGRHDVRLPQGEPGCDAWPARPLMSSGGLGARHFSSCGCKVFMVEGKRGLPITLPPMRSPFEPSPGV